MCRQRNRSESYKQIHGFARGIESLKRITANQATFERKSASNGRHYFVLRAANHVIGKSHTYSSSSAHVRGIASVKRNAPAAKIVNLAS